MFTPLTGEELIDGVGGYARKAAEMAYEQSIEEQT